MRLPTPNRFAGALALTMLLAAVAPAAAAAEPAVATRGQAKHQRLRKLQKLNRVYQVCYGRSLRRDESAQILTLTEPQLVQKMLSSEELARVYARRLADFAGNVRSVAAAAVPERVTALARPTDKLDRVLGALDRDRHKGEPCGEHPSAVCFATWLVANVAPSLGYGWVKTRATQLPAWTYAKLLEEISRSSINQ